MNIDDRPLTPVPPEEDTFPAGGEAQLKARRRILKFAKPGGVGAEFGVYRGHFAAEIADHLRPKKLYLVDPWTLEGERFDWGDDPVSRLYTNDNRLTTEQALTDARLRLAPFREEIDIEFVEDFTVTFCERLTMKLDFAYIDTSHRYESTLLELEAVSKVLAEGGVIMGDDWHADPEHQHHGVVRAVNDFLHHRDFELVAAGQALQWCIRPTPTYPGPRQSLPKPFTSTTAGAAPPTSVGRTVSELATKAKDRVRGLRRRGGP